MADTVLIVDDDTAVTKMLCKVMKSNNLDSDTAESGEEAIQKLMQNRYALILLDINLHGIDGFEVIERLRSHGIRTPIIIVSGRKEDYDTLYGLDIGADDYVTKPFNPVTLGAKAKALIRRSQGELSKNETQIVAGPFTYQTSTLRLFKNGTEIVLTGKENAIMKLFLDNINHIFSKDMIYEMVWGDAVVDDNAVTVYINRLRQKIEDDPEKPRYIQTIRSIGYLFSVYS